MIIRAYGQYWNPELVTWGARGPGNSGSLLGTIKKDGSDYTIDFWNALGIYVLIDNFRPVYIGKAIGTKLGPRLKDHLTDRFAGRWDMFSWYTLSSVNTTSGNTRAPGTRQLNANTVIDTLEALSIAITDTPLNRRRESLPDAVEAVQKSGDPRSLRNYLECIYDDTQSIIEKIDELD